MFIRFYQFSKKENSTKRPGSIYKEYDCVLLDACSIESPSIRLKWTENIHDYNYVFIPDFNRYYFIKTWTFDKGHVVAAMTVDVLATYKNEIGDSMQYVTRCESKYNPHITDVTYPITNKMHRQGNELLALSTKLTYEVNHGCYVVGIVGNMKGLETTVGVLNYYVFSSKGFRDFINYVLSNDEYLNLDFTTQTPDSFIDSVGVNFVKTYFNPIQYIQSCKWYPFSWSELVADLSASDYSNVDFVGFGWWHFNAPCIRLKKQIIKTFTGSLSISPHPQADRGYYLNYEPYTKREIYIPTFGAIQIVGEYLTKEFIVQDSLKYSLEIDIMSGVAYFNIYPWHEDRAFEPPVIEQKKIVLSNSNFGIDMTISQIIKDHLTSADIGVNAFIDAVSSFTKIDIAGSIKSIYNGISDSIRHSPPQLSLKGDNGNLTSFYTKPYQLNTYTYIADENLAEHGRPLCETVKISTLSGYIQVDGAEFSGIATQSEQQTVKTYMEGGFHYE